MPTDPIKHVVVLMLENHSFDQMLGAMRSKFPTSKASIQPTQALIKTLTEQFIARRKRRRLR